MYVPVEGQQPDLRAAREKRKKKEVGEQYNFAQGIDTGGGRKKNSPYYLKFKKQIFLPP